MGNEIASNNYKVNELEVESYKHVDVAYVYSTQNHVIRS